MSFEECCRVVAESHGLGKGLVTGHRKLYFKEAAELFAIECCKATQRKILKKYHEEFIISASDIVYNGNIVIIKDKEVMQDNNS